MALEAKSVIPHPVEEIIRAYADPKFHEHLAKKVGSTLHGFDFSGSTDEAFQVVTKHAMSADKLPDIAKKVMKGDVKVTVTEDWSAAGHDGKRTSAMTVKIVSAPVSAEASQTLEPRGDAETASTVTGEVNTSIPLIGKKLKSAAEPYMRKFVEVQAREVSAWIKKQGS